MKTGFSSNAFTTTSLFEGMEILSNIGYDGIEIVLDSPHAFLPLKNEQIDKIQNTLKKHSLTVANLNSNTVLGWSPSNENPFEPSLSNKNK